ncbi:hypothetical protein ACGFH8_11840 [Micromonospora sp. NPDC049175]|uniref:hypothetical protein n=1 Tax=Micromonospora sp. NPDC049175 TaxID=3364266 RepID=UPI003713A45C
MDTDTTTARYVVIAAYVTARVGSSVIPHWQGQAAEWTSVGFMRDTTLPEDVHPEDVERLLRKGMVRAATEPNEQGDDAA